jgi:hypothetical protein
MPSKKIGGQSSGESQEFNAASADRRANGTRCRSVGAPNCDGLSSAVTPMRAAVAGDDLRMYDYRISSVIATIRDQWRQRQAWHRAEKALTLQAKALCRGLTSGDLKEADKLYSAIVGKGEHPDVAIGTAATFPLIQARDGIEKHRKAIEKLLSKQAAELPVSAWVDSVKGFGIGSLAAIVGSAGDLSNYSNPAKLWKRMGLAVMPNGERQRRFADKELAILAGYNPSRRSVVWNIGDCLIKANSPQYRPVYDKRKEYELTRTDKPIVAHARAKRYMEKRLLLDLWKAWRAAVEVQEPKRMVPPVAYLRAAE